MCSALQIKAGFQKGEDTYLAAWVPPLERRVSGMKQTMIQQRSRGFEIEFQLIPIFRGRWVGGFWLLLLWLNLQWSILPYTYFGIQLPAHLVLLLLHSSRIFFLALSQLWAGKWVWSELVWSRASDSQAMRRPSNSFIIVRRSGQRKRDESNHKDLERPRHKVRSNGRRYTVFVWTSSFSPTTRVEEKEKSKRPGRRALVRISVPSST